MIRVLLTPLQMLHPRKAGWARLPIGSLLTITCALLWALLIIRGVCFPLVVHDPKTSWGGPTLAGAWFAHFALLAAMLAAVHGLAFRLRPRTARRR